MWQLLITRTRHCPTVAHSGFSQGGGARTIPYIHSFPYIVVRRVRKINIPCRKDLSIVYINTGCHKISEYICLNPRSIGFRRVTRILLWGGGVFLVISQTTEPISKIQTTFDSPVRHISHHGVRGNWWRQQSGQIPNVWLFGLDQIGEQNDIWNDMV